MSITCSPIARIKVTGGINNISEIYPDRMKNYGNTGQGQLDSMADTITLTRVSNFET